MDDFLQNIPNSDSKQLNNSEVRKEKLAELRKVLENDIKDWKGSNSSLEEFFSRKSRM